MFFPNYGNVGVDVIKFVPTKGIYKRLALKKGNYHLVLFG